MSYDENRISDQIDAGLYAQHEQETIFNNFIDRAKQKLAQLEKENPNHHVILDFQYGERNTINIVFILEPKFETFINP